MITKHVYNTDYTIHKLFAYHKTLIACTFSTRFTYRGTTYYLKEGDSIVVENRKIVEDYFKEKPLTLYKHNSEISAKSK